MEFDRGQVAFTLTLFSFLSLFYMLREHANIFGQREHLFVLLYLPYFVARHVRWQGGALSPFTGIVVGMAAAVGACVKPFFVVVVLAVELYWMISKRSARNLVRVETIAFACVCIGYAAHLLQLPDDMAEALFGRWLPFVSQHYDVYNQPFSSLLTNPLLFVIPSALAAVPLSFLVRARQNSLAAMIRPLTVFIIGSLAVYLYQHKLWDYHLMPVMYGVVIVVGISLYEHARCPVEGEEADCRHYAAWSIVQALAIIGPVAWLLRRTSRAPYTSEDMILATCIFVDGLAVFYAVSVLRGRIGPGRSAVRLLLVAGIGIAVLLLGLSPWQRRDPLQGDLMAEVINEHTQEGDHVLVLSTSMGRAYPLLVQMNRRPASRYLTTLVAAMLYEGTTPDQDGRFPYRVGEGVPDEERRFIMELAGDIARTRPRLILVSGFHNCQGCPEGFALTDYITETGFVEEAMGDYTTLEKIGGYEAFLLQD
jgi:hypothetical protein